MDGQPTAFMPDVDVGRGMWAGEISPTNRSAAMATPPTAIAGITTQRRTLTPPAVRGTSPSDHIITPVIDNMHIAITVKGNA